MSRNLLALSVTTTLFGGTAFADVPKVAVDIAPVHSLVARVMDGVGTPDLVIPSEASPHGYSLRPSEAAALQNANVVFWIGEGLTPWLADAMSTLAEDAVKIEMLESGEIKQLPFREGALFEAHEHGDHEDDHDHAHDDHGHEEDHDHAHDDHGHEEDHDHAHDDHDHKDDHAHDDHHGHDHSGADPHAWLSPNNAIAWLDVIAGQLSAVDPDNAGAYFANSAAAKGELEALKAEISAELEPVKSENFIVFHDAYQYFETSFGMQASGAISLGDATAPGPARIREIQGRIAEQDITCVLSEPQFNPGMVATVMDGTDAKTAVIDPLGSDLEVGPALYPALLRNLADALVRCLK